MRPLVLTLLVVCTATANAQAPVSLDAEVPFPSRATALRYYDAQIDAVALRLDVPMPLAARRSFIGGGVLMGAFVAVFATGIARLPFAFEGDEDSSNWRVRNRRTFSTVAGLGIPLLIGGIALLARGRRLRNAAVADERAEYRRLRLERRAISRDPRFR